MQRKSSYALKRELLTAAEMKMIRDADENWGSRDDVWKDWDRVQKMH